MKQLGDVGDGRCLLEVWGLDPTETPFLLEAVADWDEENPSTLLVDPKIEPEPGRLRDFRAEFLPRLGNYDLWRRSFWGACRASNVTFSIESVSRSEPARQSGWLGRGAGPWP